MEQNTITSGSIEFEIIKVGAKSLAVPTVFVNEDGFPQMSRCNECNKFNRRLTAPNSVKTTTGEDGRTYITPKVDYCWQHDPVGKGSQPVDVEWMVYRSDYFVRIEHKWKEPARTRRGQQPTKMSSRDPVWKSHSMWVRADLVEQFIANPPFKLSFRGRLAPVSV